ncbi:hypothetical protein TrVE_jg12900 [Triparma verrucosa]|uniref:Tryptophan synthase beta chain-like PALP domain-containing protein n=1 Tax=Triparma verrucosa TaxID=1606542 RepID=A0A9W7KTD4_9STRA|nr:hypothetical protein TrVE_jg12900 [Triparma verrucosa]
MFAKTCEVFELIKPFIRRTPLLKGDSDEGIVYFKMENLQFTGSFKLRGALSKVLTLSKEEKRGLITTASTGNHGLACISAFKESKVSGVIYLPGNVSQYKLAKLKALVGESGVKVVGKDTAESEAVARSDAAKANGCYISPYNDTTVASGQGTIGLEVIEQLKLEGVAPDNVYIPVGGGDLITGIASTIKALYPDCRIVGCSPENSPCLELSVKAGRVLREGEFKNDDTYSSGTAGGIDDDSFTVEACSFLVDEWIQVSEKEIKEGVRFMFDKFKQVVEGAAGCGVAGYTREVVSGGASGGVSVVVCCGGNVDAKLFAKMIS